MLVRTVHHSAPDSDRLNCFHWRIGSCVSITSPEACDTRINLQLLQGPLSSIAVTIFFLTNWWRSPQNLGNHENDQTDFSYPSDRRAHSHSASGPAGRSPHAASGSPGRSPHAS